MTKPGTDPHDVLDVHLLLVAADRHSRTLLTHAVDEIPHTRLTVAFSPGEARILLNAYRYGVVIATNLGLSPWLSLDVVPVEHSYEAMFIGGYWDDDFVQACAERRLRCVRVPAEVDTLREEIAQAVAAQRSAGGTAQHGSW